MDRDIPTKALHEIAFSAEQGLKHGNDSRRELHLIQNIVEQALAPKTEDKAVERTLIELRRKMKSELVYLLVPVRVRYTTRRGRADVLNDVKESLGMEVAFYGESTAYAKTLKAKAVKEPDA